jgi:non-lysosomal glucosylceramidase
MKWMIILVISTISLFSQDINHLNKLLIKNEKDSSMKKRNTYTNEEIFCKNDVGILKNNKLSQVAFPLGGIGAGNVSIGGRGQLRDWEVFNRPAKNRALPYTFFSIWVKEGNKPGVAKILEARRKPPYAAAFGLPTVESAGLPRLEEVELRGEYPFAYLKFKDALPLDIALESFTPFIPMDSKNSSLPAAIFKWKIKNTSSKQIKGTLAFSMQNPIGIESNNDISGSNTEKFFGKNLNTYFDEDKFRGLKMTSVKYKKDDLRFGEISITTPYKNIFYLTHWERAGWWDDIQHFWDEFRMTGEIECPKDNEPTPDGRTDVGTLALKFDLKPGEEVILPFILTWYFPNRVNYWDPEKEVSGKHLKNWYGKEWKGAWDISNYIYENYQYLEGMTKKYHDVLFNTSIPGYALDAVSSQSSIMTTTTTLRLDDDKFYAFEGCHDDKGCCPMNCTHVWNYEQALAFLFPDLERTMRMTDFQVNTRQNGQMAFRSKLPAGLVLWDFRPAADGQMGCILKLYREWKISGDDKFLKELWPGAKRAFEYVWDHWDKDRDGVMEDEQHNTYDIEFFGMNTLTSSFYIAALRAMEEMADYLGEKNNAKKYHEFYLKGKNKIDKELFNGEYYFQKYDEKDLKAQKYQYGSGCLADQLLGQWFARITGLGYIFKEENVKKALESVFNNNWLTDFTNHNNVQRVYAINDEKGLLLCTWPKGGRPKYPFTYSDEVWTGIEYQVAGHLIYEGFIKEGLSIVKGVRERYDGERRNPWNEVECGNHYARAMASWSVLLALSGFEYDGVNKSIGFNPVINEDKFNTFFSAGKCWGNFSRTKNKKNIIQKIELEYGSLNLKKYNLYIDEKETKNISVKANNDLVDFKLKNNSIIFNNEIELKAGGELEIEISVK